MSTETPKSPPHSDDADDDSDVIGFADAPYPREEPIRNATITNAADPTPRRASIPQNENENVVTVPAPPEQNDPPANIQLKGWRKDVESICWILVFFTPWAISLILSWMPITKISLHEATTEVMISIIASTVEIGSMILLPIVHATSEIDSPCFQPSARTREISKKIFNIWIYFLILDPIITGSCVWAAVDSSPCKSGSGSAQCRVGDDLIRAIGVYRVFGILGVLMLCACVSSSIAKRLRKQQQRVDSEA
ncbi:hypothetical protein BKA56DRAFT_179961 [Ilyonectria sp. MPI-CAGE-AT-0026]|nr:hypothetical protein BKA56DRAFT_179961 [Ilyonectria sp. MPI-CAGE-AT-0026]